MKPPLFSAAFVGISLVSLASDTATPASPPPVELGAVYQNAGGTKLRILLDQKSFQGTELEIGEITFVPNTDSGDHVHGTTETFYVLEGELEHIVNGKSEKLGPGMLGTVRPPDKVRHKTGPAGARALVIWAPAGEAARIASRWKRVDGSSPQK
jgi:quercetin dioxygenase-like cupin family protein